ncbi:MAG: SPOR domain-containing protein [Pseudohongiella sp.]
MNQNTRQRLIGTLVLAVAALILLPVIFDGEGSYQPVLQTDIPSRPAQPVPARTDPQRPVITADTDAILIDGVADSAGAATTTENATENATEDNNETDADTANSPVATEAPVVTEAADNSEEDSAPSSDTDGSNPQTATAPPPTLDNQGLPEGFSVRLGSFGNTTNASNLVARLQEAGHRAYTRRIDSSQGVLTAVFVGPVVDRGTANILLETLREDFELNGMIVRFEIEEL